MTVSAEPKPVSKRFLAVAIDRMQRRSIEDGQFSEIVSAFIRRAGALAWDESRGLFWVEHPLSGWQVAVWLMPVALRLKPHSTGDS